MLPIGGGCRSSQVIVPISYLPTRPRWRVWVNHVCPTEGGAEEMLVDRSRVGTLQYALLGRAVGALVGGRVVGTATISK